MLCHCGSVDSNTNNMQLLPHSVRGASRQGLQVVSQILPQALDNLAFLAWPPSHLKLNIWTNYHIHKTQPCLAIMA